MSVAEAALARPEAPSTPTTGRRWPRAVVPVLVGYAALRAVAVIGATPRVYNDSAAYQAMASVPLFSRELFAGTRPWTVPLLYKALPDSDTWRVAGAVAVSVLCWSAFALVASSCLRSPRLRWIGLLGLLACSLADPVVQWDPLLLTESVSLSLTVLVAAAWLLLARAPSWGRAALLAAATVLWIFVRDPHAYVALFTCGVVVLHLWRRTSRRPGPTLAVVAVVVAAAATSLASVSTDGARPVRVDTPMLHILGGRIIPDPEAAAWFHSNGMPLNPEIRELAPDLGFASAPEPTERTEPLYRWAREEGRTTYARYLLEHPIPSASAVARRTDDLLLLGRVERYRAEGSHAVLPRPIEAVLLHPLALLALAVLFGVAASVGRYRRHLSRPLVGVAAVALLAQVPYTALVVHGDTIELGRHALEVSLVVRLCVALLGLAAADALLRGRTRPAD